MAFCSLTFVPTEPAGASQVGGQSGNELTVRPFAQGPPTEHCPRATHTRTPKECCPCLQRTKSINQVSVEFFRTFHLIRPTLKVPIFLQITTKICQK